MCAFLNLDKRANLGIVPDTAAVQIDELAKPYIASANDVQAYILGGVHAVFPFEAR